MNVIESTPNNENENETKKKNQKTKRKSIAIGHFTAGVNASKSSQLLADLGFPTPKRTVQRWYQEFKDGNLSAERKLGSGRPKVIDYEERIEKVKDLIVEDRLIPIRDLSAITTIPFGSVFNIIHNEINVKKLKGIWVPHELTDSQKKVRVDWCQDKIRQFRGGRLRKVDSIVTVDETWINFHTTYFGNKRQWLFADEDYPQVPKMAKTSNKRMFTIFFNSTGILLSQFQEQGYTVTSIDYLDALKSVKEKLTESGIMNPILHQDNCRIHLSRDCQKYYANEWELMKHPPYSPDLAPCDFWLFKKVKEEFRGKRFKTDIELATAVDLFIHQIPKSEFEKCFKIWFERMHKCIEAGGNYFELKKRRLLPRNSNITQ